MAAVQLGSPHGVLAPSAAHRLHRHRLHAPPPPQVPQPLPEAAIAAAARQQGDALRLLRRLLQQRPVWPAAALQEAYAEAAGLPLVGGRSGAEDLLPKLCYKFRNGERGQGPVVMTVKGVRVWWERWFKGSVWWWWR